MIATSTINHVYANSRQVTALLDFLIFKFFLLIPSCLLFINDNNSGFLYRQKYPSDMGNFFNKTDICWHSPYTDGNLDDSQRG